jgi:hypothetical protein
MPEQTVGKPARAVRVMLVEDHADFRRAMASLLGRQPDLEVVAQAGSLGEVRRGDPGPRVTPPAPTSHGLAPL